MGDFIDIATKIFALSERRVEVSAQNIANVSTPGYKRRISFSSAVAQSGQNIVTDTSEGKLANTGNPYDLAIMGRGYFAVRGPDGLLYTRKGQFHPDADGRLVNPEGYVLQSDGGDLIVGHDPIQVLDDGVMTAAGEPVAKLALFDFTDPGKASTVDGAAFRAAEADMTAVARPAFRQGALEASNVSTGDEMVGMMEALRQAESAQRLVGVYDDLMGRALNAFGQS
jgi:flagellar basal-body rod protein FlgF